MAGSSAWAASPAPPGALPPRTGMAGASSAEPRGRIGGPSSTQMAKRWLGLGLGLGLGPLLTLCNPNPNPNPNPN